MKTDYVYAYIYKDKDNLFPAEHDSQLKILYIGRTDNKKRRDNEHKGHLKPENSNTNRLKFHFDCIQKGVTHEDLICKILDETHYDEEQPYETKEFEYFIEAFKQGHPLTNKKMGDRVRHPRVKEFIELLQTGKVKLTSFKEFNKAYDKWLEEIENSGGCDERGIVSAYIVRTFEDRGGWRRTRNGSGQWKYHNLELNGQPIDVKLWKSGSGNDFVCSVSIISDFIDYNSGYHQDKKYYAIRRAAFAAIGKWLRETSIEDEN